MGTSQRRQRGGLVIQKTAKSMKSKESLSILPRDQFFPLFFSYLVLFSFGVFISSCKSLEVKKDASSEKIISLQNEELVIGHVGAFTGSEASFGQSIRNGIQMAVAMVNKRGGVKGKTLRLISKDDHGDPKQSEKTTENLIKEDKVIAILGAAASSRSIAMAKVAQKHGIPMITPSSTNPKVTEVGDFVFRVCFIDPFQGPVMARYVFEVMKAKKVAIIRDIKSEYSVGLAQFFKQKFVEMGGEVVQDQSYSALDVDFKSQLSAIKAAKPELIYVPGYYSDVANIIVQARKMGIKVPFAGGDGWESSELFKIGGDSLEGSFFTSHYSPSKKDPILRKFVSLYRKKYGVIPDALAALGYDAAQVLIEALKKSPDLNPITLRNAIASTLNYKGVTGNITLDSNRNAVKSAVIYTIAKGKPKYVHTVAP